MSEINNTIIKMGMFNVSNSDKEKPNVKNRVDRQNHQLRLGML